MKAPRGRLLLWSIVFIILATLTAAIFLNRNMPLSFRTTRPNTLIRLHVIANSDTLKDQELKLKVRDAIIQEARKRLVEVQEVEEARRWLAGNLASLAKVAEAQIKKEGYPYSVRVQLGDFNFPTRSYGRWVLPAGEYEALRLIIGEGKGENWWCILFPPLCLVDVAEGRLSHEVMAWPEDSLPNTPVELRFKILEVLRASTQRLASLWW